MRVAGADVDLLATTEDGEPLEKRDEVLIVEMRAEGTAVVTRNLGLQVSGAAISSAAQH